ncbi:hypothetical protein FRACYDRAFT_258386 [Fragilariopsis cylindrus CCMP1102]|uniref:Uncharacterized protein n=1 Tax=Fragilariopsis cylindrus CCMP1102 TaxID=635003 RepID=A0A1E7EJF2_9STRA|nr:hypothetical protein FRACYDRAFT_258386 [Fragilariopsis cylindrus CCMP1102]|eukprot:OEU05753.1 hypothetical protein FRACYDRAFT_258386 [Fragilariopsis cylindrus CCMP1102]
MDQARNTIVDDSDSDTATKSQNHSTISGIASATSTKSAEIDSTGSSTSSCTASKKLRKGKWTIEEEEYTSRIIQYFSTGLLTLPDGATLRSYLADKLNCDPMRITKKFTGACCLGRRAYHLRDRPRASFAEVEMANLELLHLERRFRLRVEHEQTGLPLPLQHYKLLASQPSQPLPPQATHQQQQQQQQQQGAAVVSTTIPTVNANNNPWLQQQNSTIPPNLASLLPGLTGNISNTAFSGFNLNTMAGQLLLQNPNERAHTVNPVLAATPSPQLPQLQVLNNILASLNFSQVLAANQQAGVSQLQQHGSIVSPSTSSAAIVTPSPVAAPAASTTAPISSIYAAPISTFYPASIAANSSITNNRTAISMPVLGNNQEQHSEQVQLYQKQLEKKKFNSSTVPGSGLTKEERAEQLKAAFEEQQRALRSAYEKSLRDAQEQDREEQSSSPDSAATIASDLSNGKVATASTNCNSSSNTKIPPETISPAELLQTELRGTFRISSRRRAAAGFL